MDTTLKSTLLIACGALAREIKLVQRQGGWDHVSVLCLPADLHNRPAEIPAAVRQVLENATGRYAEVFVAYADCGTGGRLDSVLKEFGVERLPGAHCYEFFSGAEHFAALQDEELGTFYLTDFLVRHFDRLVVQALGLDRHPELMSQYFGNYKRVVHLSQVRSESLASRARECAERLGLEFESHFTGLEPLFQEIRFERPETTHLEEVG